MSKIDSNQKSFWQTKFKEADSRAGSQERGFLLDETQGDFTKTPYSRIAPSFVNCLVVSRKTPRIQKKKHTLFANRLANRFFWGACFGTKEGTMAWQSLKIAGPNFIHPHPPTPENKVYKRGEAYESLAAGAA